MTEETQKKELISIEEVVNWILLLVIFSVLVSIGSYVGYHHPIGLSLVGMFILSFVTLIGMLLEKYIPYNISSIIYISVIDLIIALPIMPTSEFVIYYVSHVELLSIVTVFLAYVGIGIDIGKSWDQFKSMGFGGILVTMAVITGTFLGSAIIAHFVLVLTGTPV